MDSLDKENWIDVGNTLSDDTKGHVVEIWKSDISDILREQPESISLEEENHRIDKELSVEQKLWQWWEKHLSAPYIFKKIPGSEDDAYVYEYIGALWPSLIWEQLFTWAAVLNLWLDGLLPSKEEFQKIERDMSEGSFFRAHPIPHAGFRIPDSGHTRQAFFHQVGHQASFRLKWEDKLEWEDKQKWGDNVILKENNATIYGSKNMRYAYSLRLKKR